MWNGNIWCFNESVTQNFVGGLRLDVFKTFLFSLSMVIVTNDPPLPPFFFIPIWMTSVHLFVLFGKKIKCWTFSTKIIPAMPAKWLCDASSVLVGAWLLITLRFQPSPLASKLLAAPRKGEQSISLSLPVHSLSTASPMQCLLAAAGVYGCRKAPEPNCKGEISITQR